MLEKENEKERERVWEWLRVWEREKDSKCSQRVQERKLKYGFFGIIGYRGYDTLVKDKENITSNSFFSSLNQKRNRCNGTPEALAANRFQFNWDILSLVRKVFAKLYPCKRSFHTIIVSHFNEFVPGFRRLVNCNPHQWSITERPGNHFRRNKGNINQLIQLQL